MINQSSLNLTISDLNLGFCLKSRFDLKNGLNKFMFSRKPCNLFQSCFSPIYFNIKLLPIYLSEILADMYILILLSSRYLSIFLSKKLCDHSSVYARLGRSVVQEQIIIKYEENSKTVQPANYLHIFIYTIRGYTTKQNKINGRKY